MSGANGSSGSSGSAAGRPPRISVIIAAYNAAPFIAGTIRSALAQTFRDLEVTVVDDGSTDDTGAVVRALIADDPRVRLLTHPNRGVSATRNRAIAETRGELVAFLDHDDLWHPEKLAQQVALLDARPATGVVTCHSAVIDQNHRCLGWRLGGNPDGDVYAEMLEWDMVSGGSVVLVRRSALTAAGPFDERLHVREDWDLWIRLARRVPFATVAATLVGYTRRSTSTSRDYTAMADEGLAVLAKASREDPAFRGRRHRYCVARDCFAIASFCAIDGQVGPAWRYLARSLRHTPAPVMRSPRRWAFVAVLLLRTVLPPAVFQRTFGALTRMTFALTPGRPFEDV